MAAGSWKASFSLLTCLAPMNSLGSWGASFSIFDMPWAHEPARLQRVVCPRRVAAESFGARKLPVGKNGSDSKRDSRNIQSEWPRPNSVCCASWPKNTAWSSSPKLPDLHRFMGRHRFWLVSKTKRRKKGGARLLPALRRCARQWIGSAARCPAPIASPGRGEIFVETVLP